MLEQLIQMYDMVESLADEQAKDIVTVAFSDVLRRSSNASSKYPNVMYDKNVKRKPLPAPFSLRRFVALPINYRNCPRRYLTM